MSYLVSPKRAEELELFARELIITIMELQEKHHVRLAISKAGDFLEIYDLQAKVPEDWHVAEIHLGEEGFGFNMAEMIASQPEIKLLNPELAEAIRKSRGANGKKSSEAVAGGSK